MTFNFKKPLLIVFLVLLFGLVVGFFLGTFYANYRLVAILQRASGLTGYGLSPGHFPVIGGSGHIDDSTGIVGTGGDGAGRVATSPTSTLTPKPTSAPPSGGGSGYQGGQGNERFCSDMVFIFENASFFANKIGWSAGWLRQAALNQMAAAGCVW